MVISSLEIFFEVVMVVVDVDVVVVEMVALVQILVVPSVFVDWHFDLSIRNLGGCTIPDCRR